MRISERCALIPLVESKDYGSVGIDFDSVNMGKLHSLSVAIAFGALTGNSVLTVYHGATAGAKTTAVAFKYRLGAADFKVALADQLGDATDVLAAGLTLTAATFDHRLVVIEIDADTVTEGKPWLTVSVDATASALNVGAVGVGTHRYPSHTMPSAI